MSRMANLIEQMETLVSEYGIKNVREALNFVDSYEESNKRFNSDNVTTLSTNYGFSVKLSRDDVFSIRDIYRAGNRKIGAIKRIREITACGLKEAKDIFEQNTDYLS